MAHPSYPHVDKATVLIWELPWGVRNCRYILPCLLGTVLSKFSMVQWSIICNTEWLSISIDEHTFLAWSCWSILLMRSSIPTGVTLQVDRFVINSVKGSCLEKHWDRERTQTHPEGWYWIHQVHLLANSLSTTAAFTDCLFGFFSFYSTNIGLATSSLSLGCETWIPPFAVHFMCKKDIPNPTNGRRLGRLQREILCWPLEAGRLFWRACNVVGYKFR